LVGVAGVGIVGRRVAATAVPVGTMSVAVAVGSPIRGEVRGPGLGVLPGVAVGAGVAVRNALEGERRAGQRVVFERAGNGRGGALASPVSMARSRSLVGWGPVASRRRGSSLGCGPVSRAGSGPVFLAWCGPVSRDERGPESSTERPSG